MLGTRFGESEDEDGRKGPPEETRSAVGEGASSRQQVAAYRNERYYPLFGWSQRLLPTDPPALSDEQGTRDLAHLFRQDDDDRDLPQGYAWCWLEEAWREDPFVYSADFAFLRSERSGSTSPSATSLVRRKRMVRLRVLVRRDEEDATLHAVLGHGVAENREQLQGIIQALGKDLAAYKRALSETTTMLVQKDKQLADLKRKLIVSEERYNGLLSATKNAIVRQSSSRSRNRISSSSESEESEFRSPDRDTNIVDALNEQFENDEISIDDYALALSSLAQGGQGELAEE